MELIETCTNLAPGRKHVRHPLLLHYTWSGRGARNLCWLWPLKRERQKEGKTEGSALAHDCFFPQLRLILTISAHIQMHSWLTTWVAQCFETRNKAPTLNSFQPLNPLYDASVLCFWSVWGLHSNQEDQLGFTGCGLVFWSEAGRWTKLREANA